MKTCQPALVSVIQQGVEADASWESAADSQAGGLLARRAHSDGML